MKGEPAPEVRPSKAFDLITAPCVSERPARGELLSRDLVGGLAWQSTPQSARIKKALCKSRWYDIAPTTLLLQLTFNEYLYQ